MTTYITYIHSFLFLSDFSKKMVYTMVFLSRFNGENDDRQINWGTRFSDTPLQTLEDLGRVEVGHQLMG